MERSLAQHHASFIRTPGVRSVTASAPFRWLATGWSDLRTAPALGLAYGLIIALLGYGLSLAAWNVPILVLTFVSGFLLVAPLLAVGLYEVSRRLEAGERPTWAHVAGAWARNRWPLVFMGAILGFLMIAWGRLTGLLAALSFPLVGPEGHMVTWATVTSAEGLGFLGLFVAMGAGLAAIVFAITAVSIPMLLDRSVDTVTAIATSVRAVTHNLPAMAVWAALIVALTGVGLATGYLGLIVTMPLVGHATWHAYRELVAD
jgi:uncharacterized membrane protein